MHYPYIIYRLSIHCQYIIYKYYTWWYRYRVQIILCFIFFRIWLFLHLLVDWAGHESRRCLDHHDVHRTILGPTSPGLPGSPWNPELQKTGQLWGHVFTCFHVQDSNSPYQIQLEKARLSFPFPCCSHHSALSALCLSQAVTYKGNHSFQLVLGNLYELLDGRQWSFPHALKCWTGHLNGQTLEAFAVRSSSLNGQWASQNGEMPVLVLPVLPVVPVLWLRWSGRQWNELGQWRTNWGWASKRQAWNRAALFL